MMSVRLVQLRVVALLGVAACGEPLTAADVIEDTRPLALRIEVEDASAGADDPVRCEALPLERASFTPWVVDTDGPLDSQEIGDLNPVWIACNMDPVQPLFGCLQSNLPLELSDIPDCEAPDPTDFELDPSNPPNSVSPCRIVDGARHRPELVVPLDADYLLGGDVEITMIASVPGKTDTLDCAEALLSESQDLSPDCLYGTQRLPIGPDALLLQLAADLGFDLGDLGVTPEEAPDPDTNPRIVRFEGRLVDGDEEPGEPFAINRGDTIDVGYGERLLIEAEAPESDLQTYLIPEDNDKFQEESELYEASWFRTWGTLVNAGTDDPIGKNEWIMEPDLQDDGEPASGDRATLYFVVRDNRAGVDWWWFHVRLTGAPDF